MTEPKKIRVLVVDDSPTFRTALSIALASDPEIQVVGQAADGNAAVALTSALKPDIITMDVIMPVMDGIEAAGKIMASRPTPIVLMSTLARTEEQRVALNALRLGVVDVSNKPVLAGPDGPAGIAAVIRLVKAAAQVEVHVRPRTNPLTRPMAAAEKRAVGLIAIAASTGGPPALEQLLTQLPLDCPPVVIAQHLAPSFTRGFADWLSGVSGRPVLNVTITEPLKPGTVYIASENQHIRVRQGYADGVAILGNELAPNADVLFQSVAGAFREAAVGIVLTGMGNDGAQGLKAMRTGGAWTIGQDRESSVVYGMPRVAYEAGACCEVLPLDEIAGRVIGLLSTK